MKTKLALILLSLVSLTTLTFGQAGVGSQGTPYIDYRNSKVDFGTFYIDRGVLTGTATGSSVLLSHATVAISSADLLALYSAPKLLVAAPGSGHSLAVVKVIFAITRTATVYVTGGGAAIIQYNSTTHGGGTQACDSTIAATVITGTAGLSNTIRNGAVISDSSATDNQGLYLSAATGDFTAGTGTAVADVWYAVN